MKKKIIILFLAMIAAAGTVNAKPVKYLKCGCRIIEGAMGNKCGECGKSLTFNTKSLSEYQDKYGNCKSIRVECSCNHYHILPTNSYGSLLFDYLPASEATASIANHVHTKDKCIAVVEAKIKDEKGHSTGYFMIRVTNRCPASANSKKPIVFEIPGKTKEPVTLYYGNSNSWNSLEAGINFRNGSQVDIKLIDR